MLRAEGRRRNRIVLIATGATKNNTLFKYGIYKSAGLSRLSCVTAASLSRVNSSSPRVGN